MPKAIKLSYRGRPKCVLTVTRSGEIAVPPVEEAPPTGAESFGGRLKDILATLTFGFAIPRSEPRFVYADPRSALSPDLIRMLHKQTGSEFADSIDLIQRLVSKDFPDFYEINGKPLRVRINVTSGGFRPLRCPIFATWSYRAESIVYYALGTGLQFGEWANRYHRHNKNLLAACDVLAAHTMLLIPRITTFAARPDCITKFGLV